MRFTKGLWTWNYVSYNKYTQSKENIYTHNKPFKARGAFLPLKSTKTQKLEINYILFIHVQNKTINEK